jgi:Flp pilus assembly protein CpaB
MGAFVGFLLIAICLGGLAFYLRESSKQEIESLRRTVPVVIAAIDLPAGAVITLRDISLKQVNPNSKEPGAFEDLSDPALIGGTLKVEVLDGQTIYQKLYWFK